ncbi:anti-sigma factor [Taibaiella koreensis]|uniref:anti-sigma factor n=1 Tax=Taibaiella koreensis TaxID=1268548 RepID=UPI0013C3500D|nr:anti-sigma factor [Taibaiella koreensis]
MDIQQYISSGVIEAYVLGIAADEDVRELEQLSHQYPEIAAAVEEYRRSLEAYADALAITPPAGLKDQIWSAIQADEQQLPVVHPSQEHTGSTFDFATNEGKGGRRVRLYRSLAAAVALLLGSITLNIVLWNQSQQTGKKMSEMKQEQQRMLADNQDFRSRLEQSAHQLDLLLDPFVKSIVLAGVGAHTNNNAMLLWDGRSKDVYLSLKNMPLPPAGKQYQLWAIVNGKPVSAGVYTMDGKQAMQKMKTIPQAEMFAITLEQEGGSETPTLDEMYVAGKVQG